jgi:hypothetical protein
MAVFNTSRSRNPYQGVGHGWGRELVHDVVSVAMTTAMIDNADDDVGLLYLPAGAVVVGAALKCTDMDTNGTPTLAIDVGDAADENRIFAASQAGRTGTLDVAIASTGYLWKTTAPTQLRAYIQTAAATGAAGTLTFGVTYFVDPEFTSPALVASVG